MAGGTLGSGTGESPRAFSVAQPASQTGKGVSVGAPSSKEGNFWLAQHLSGAVQEPGRGEGRMGCPKGSPEKHTWSAPLPHGAELSATLLPGLQPQPTPRSHSMIHWSLVDTSFTYSRTTLCLEHLPPSPTSLSAQYFRVTLRKGWEADVWLTKPSSPTF